MTNLLHHFYVHKVLNFIPDGLKYIIHGGNSDFYSLLVVLQKRWLYLSLIKQHFQMCILLFNQNLKCFDNLSIKKPFRFTFN